MTRQMHLGSLSHGVGGHVAGWRMPGAEQRFTDIQSITRIAQTAEAARFDMIFMGDNLYADPAAHPSYTLRLEPLTMLSAVARVEPSSQLARYAVPEDRNAVRRRGLIFRGVASALAAITFAHAPAALITTGAAKLPLWVSQPSQTVISFQ